MFEHFVHHPLICCPYILQIERHNPVAVDSSFSYEGCFLFINWMHKDLMVSIVYIQWTEKLIPRCLIHQFIYLGLGVVILWACLFQVCEFHTYLSFVVDLLYHHNVGESFGVPHLSYESCLYEFIHLFRDGILLVPPYTSLLLSYWKEVGVYTQPMWSYL